MTLLDPKNLRIVFNMQEVHGISLHKLCSHFSLSVNHVYKIGVYNFVGKSYSYVTSYVHSAECPGTCTRICARRKKVTRNCCC